jgi:hypothetical protein
MPPLITLRAILLNCFLLVIPMSLANAQQELPELDVSGRPWGEDIVGPYHQPRWSARGRFSADTDVYVLPPYSLSLDLDYHGTFPRHGGKSDHVFVQELEMGLPHRFQIAWEFYQEVTNGHRQLQQTLIEARYAFADWGKIPLNPTFLGEYKWGLGKNFSDTGDTSDEGGESQGPRGVSDSYELRLLLGQEIGKLIEFAGNIFFEQAANGTREREMGFSTAWSYALRGEALKVGVETSYSNESEHGARSKAKNIFELGLSFTVKPSPHTRIDLAPLFGVTNKSPAAEVFMIFAIDFGTGAAGESEGPVSARFR